MLGISTFYYENPHLYFTEQVQGGVVNPFDPENQEDDEGNDTGYDKIFEQFEGTDRHAKGKIKQSKKEEILSTHEYEHRRFLAEGGTVRQVPHTQHHRR